MSSILSQINFGNETGEDATPEELAAYFYEQTAFADFIDANSRICVATAKKGVGKSALLRWTAQKARAENPHDLVIGCRGADLVRARFNLKTMPSTPNDYIHDWMIRLCAIANRHLAQRIGFALTDDSITLVESAEIEGYRTRNLIGCLLDRFQRLIPGGGPEKAKINEEIEILRRQKSHRIWILIDDLDATFQNTTLELLELSTFFSACRYLIQDIQGICIRVTLRTDVWPLIRRYDESLDKMEQYVREIAWGRGDFLGILYKRIRAQVESKKLKLPTIRSGATAEEVGHEYLNLVMVPQMEWAEKQVPNFQVIYTLSYQRPRWGIQLCKLAQDDASRSQEERIEKHNIDAVWGEFGTKRIADLVAEHKHQCRDVEELILSFRGCERLLTRDALFDWINRRVIPHINTRIEGRDISSAKQVARFLYRIGFIIARSDSNEGYEHYTFDQMPDFLSSRTDEDFGVAWEIHPCYREALDIQKVDRSHRARFGRMRGKTR